MFCVYNTDFDKVINSVFVNASISYKDAIHHLVPLIDRLSYQRTTLKPKFYQRLESDLVKGCIMPPITIAFYINDENKSEQFDLLKGSEQAYLNSYIDRNINSAFILDGIQRLNTLSRLTNKDGFDPDKLLYANILICESMDKLLYRMITLNNGQKPMTARHQVEILASNIFNFDNKGLLIQTDKQKKIRKVNGSFAKSDLITAYLAFISASINIDNEKIIATKMEELITEQIVTSETIASNIEFSDVVLFISEMCESQYNRTWLLNANNLVGFCSAMSKSFEQVRALNYNEFENNCKLIDEVINNLELSKIRLGTVRRKVTQFFYSKFSENIEKDADEILRLVINAEIV